MTTSTRFAVYGANGAPAFLSVRLAQVAALAAHTVSDDGNVLTASGNGALTVDSVGAAVDDLIGYVPSGPALAESGVYVVTSPGSGGTPWVLTRLSALASGVKAGRAFVLYVELGTVRTGFIYGVRSSVSPGVADITMGTTTLAVTQLNAATVVPGTTGSGGAVATSAGAAHAHGVTDGGHAHGGATGGTSTNNMGYQTLTAPALAGVAAHAQFLDDAGPIVGGFTNPPTPRNMVFTFGAGWAASPGGDLTYSGTDQDDAAFAVVVAANPGGTTVCPVITKTSTGIVYAAGAGGGTHSVDIATGDKLGITDPAIAAAIGLETVDGAIEAATWDITLHQRGFTPTTPANGAHNYAILFPKPATSHTHTVASGVTGVAVDSESTHTHTGGAHTHTI